jgi:ketosteroid isomerase-like protein
MSDRSIHAVGCLLMALAAAMPCAADAAESTPLPPGLDLLRRFERAFAKTTSEIGLRNGFLMFFDEDALSPPDTSDSHSWLLAGPAPVEYRPTDLLWEPLFGDIARSGDLGYLTGPSSFTDRAGGKHTGVYFSIWERDGLGLWRVVLDVGTDTPGPAPEFDGTSFRAAAAGVWRAEAADSTRSLAELRDSEHIFLAAAGENLITAYERFLAPAARLHREGHHPITGADAIATALAGEHLAVRGRLFRAGVSKAGDLGWTFGPAELVAGGRTQQGSYTSVWQRDVTGQWRIVVSVCARSAGDGSSATNASRAFS